MEKGKLYMFYDYDGVVRVGRFDRSFETANGVMHSMKSPNYADWDDGSMVISIYSNQIIMEVGEND